MSRLVRLTFKLVVLEVASYWSMMTCSLSYNWAEYKYRHLKQTGLLNIRNTVIKSNFCTKQEGVTVKCQLAACRQYRLHILKLYHEVQFEYVPGGDGSWTLYWDFPEQNDRYDWKHHLPATSLTGAKEVFLTFGKSLVLNSIYKLS